MASRAAALGLIALATAGCAGRSEREPPRVEPVRESASFWNGATVYFLLTDRFVTTGLLEPKPFNTFKFFLTYPIPRSLYPDKPEGLGSVITRQVLKKTTTWGTGVAGHAAYEGGIIIAIMFGYLAGFGCRIFDDPLWRQPTNPFLIAMLAAAAMQLIAFAYLYSVKRGDREVYLGSPMPGLRRHLERNPGASPLAYARSTRGGLPLDPQLRYYHGKGFNELVAVVPDYFPHEASCDYGAVIKTRVPHSWLHPLMRHVPTSLLRWLAAMAPARLMPHSTRQ